jgi:hypothetical protein
MAAQHFYAPDYFPGDERHYGINDFSNEAALDTWGARQASFDRFVRRELRAAQMHAALGRAACDEAGEPPRLQRLMPAAGKSVIERMYSPVFDYGNGSDREPLAYLLLTANVADMYMGPDEYSKAQMPVIDVFAGTAHGERVEGHMRYEYLCIDQLLRGRAPAYEGIPFTQIFLGYPVGHELPRGLQRSQDSYVACLGRVAALVNMPTVLKSYTPPTDVRPSN